MSGAPLGPRELRHDLRHRVGLRRRRSRRGWLPWQQGGDCICRAIAIATEKPYREVHDELTAIGWNYRHTYWRDADGLFVPGEEAQRRERAYIASLGLQWHPTMRIGSGCKVHLRADELPSGRIIARVTRHFGHLIVLRTNESSALCACICQHTCRASFDELESGAITSCGCRPMTPSARALNSKSAEQRQ